MSFKNVHFTQVSRVGLSSTKPGLEIHPDDMSDDANYPSFAQIAEYWPG